MKWLHAEVGGWIHFDEGGDCKVCGLGFIEVTAMGEAIPTRLSRCVCPQPCCPSCRYPLDDDGRCALPTCPIWNCLVPIPAMYSAIDRSQPFSQASARA